MSAVPLGILGLGNMGRGHLRVLSMLRDADVKFVFDPDPAAPDRANALGYTGPVLSHQADLDAACGEAEALVIATPTSTHFDLIARHIDRIPHMFVEKPLTATLSEAQEIAQVARAAGVHIQVGFIQRFNPAIQTLREILGGSSEVSSVDITRTNKLSDRITDVDVVVDLMIHDLDLALFLNGPVANVHAQGVHQNGMVEFASAQLTHVNGRQSRIQASRITERKKRLVEATCRDMFVECELLRKEVLISRQSEIHAEATG